MEEEFGSNLELKVVPHVARTKLHRKKARRMKKQKGGQGAGSTTLASVKARFARAVWRGVGGGGIFALIVERLRLPERACAH